jgi:heme o synthase
MRTFMRSTRLRSLSVSPLSSSAKMLLAARRSSATLVPPPPAKATPGATEPDVASPAAATKSRSVLRVCAELSKARLSSLVVFTSSAGFLMAGVPGSWTACAAVSIGTALAAAAAGTFNQVWETGLDGRMKRTQGRPLPSGAISPAAASAFGAAMTAASAATLYFGTDPFTTALGLGNIILYACIYTPLKTRSELSTAVGAVVGAVPPVMGWSAACGGDILALEPLLLGLTLFWWQFPHFYSLGWTLRRDYTRGGYAMAPVTDPNGKRTAMLSLRSAFALAGVPVVAAIAGVTNPMFAVEGVLLNAVFLRQAWRFYAAPGDATARAVFRTSLWYLPVLLCLFVFHSSHWVEQEQAQEAQDAAAVGALPLPLPAPNEAVAADGSGIDVVVADVLRHGVLVATDTLRHAGKALCVHETVKDARTSEAASALSAALCPVPHHDVGSAGADAGASSSGSSSGSGASGLDAAASDGMQGDGAGGQAPAPIEDGRGGSVLGAATLEAAAAHLAREQVRAQCPVVAVGSAAGAAQTQAHSGGPHVEATALGESTAGVAGGVALGATV